MVALRLRTSLVVLVLASALISSCARDSPTAPTEPVVGTYTLHSVAGVSLPLVIFEDQAGQVEIVGGSIALAADLTFREVLTFRETPTGGQAETVDEELTGTYSVDGTTVNFASPEGGWVGLHETGTITYMIGNVIFTFRM